MKFYDFETRKELDTHKVLQGIGLINTQQVKLNNIQELLNKNILTKLNYSEKETITDGTLSMRIDDNFESGILVGWKPLGYPQKDFAEYSKKVKAKYGQTVIQGWWGNV